MAPFPQHQGGPGQGGMNGPGGPGAMNGPGPMNIPGGMGAPGPGGMMQGAPMGGAGVMNGRTMARRPNMTIGGGMNMPTMGMRPGAMPPRMNMSAQNGMGPSLAGQGSMLGGQGGMPGLPPQGGMPGQGNMSLNGAQGNMGGIVGQGPMGGMQNLGGGSSGMNGPGGMSMGNGPNSMSMGSGSGMSGLGSQGGISGPVSQGNMPGLGGPQSMNSQPGMRGGMNVMMGGGGGGMSNLAGGGAMGSQHGGMGGLGGLPSQGGLGTGSSNMGPGAGGPGGMGNPGGVGGMGPMNGMGPSNGPGMSMSGGNGLPGANGMSDPNNRQWPPDRQFSEDITKRPASAQLEDFGGMPGGAQHGLGGAHPGGLPHGGPQQLGPQPGQQGVGPQHGVGGPGQHAIGPQHGIGAPQQLPPGPHAGSPVNGMPAHHPQHHPVPTHIGQPPPGHMGPGGTPRMTTTPGHPGGPPHMSTSPHHMNGSPAHHQNHPHQPHHLVDSPAHQMGSPRHPMTSSSPAPGPTRSGAPTPVPPRVASTDPMMGMRPDGLVRPGLAGDQGMMRMNEGVMMRPPDGGQMRPGGDMMMSRDGRMVRDGMLPMERAPSADGMMRPGGMRTEIGRLGPDGTMLRAPGQYGQPPYGAQGPGFIPPAPGYVLTPAQQHQNMQMRKGGDEMPILSDQMGLPGEMGGDMVPSGPGRRTSMPPQMSMPSGPGPMSRPNQGPGPGPGGPPSMAGMPQRRTTMSQPRQITPGSGILRMLQMSQEMSETNHKTLEQWVKFRNEYFVQDAKIDMTIFQGVEGRRYEVLPPLLARFFWTFFDSGVSKMSINLNGPKEIIDDSISPFDSVVETIQGIWRYELTNGWVVEHSGPFKANMVMVTDPHAIPGEQQSKLKIVEIAFNAPVSSYLFKLEQLEGNRVSGPAPMTPRISPGLAARRTDGGMDDSSGNSGREEEMLVFENARLPPKPFQKHGLPENVWKLLVMSTSAHELGPLMQMAHENQAGPLATLDQFVDMHREARIGADLPFLPDDLSNQFPSFDFTNPSNMSNSSPALTHAHPGMRNPQGSMTAGRPTPTPPLPRGNRGEPLAGSGELPPLPGLGIAPPGMMSGMMHQSPSMTHPMPPGQANGQGGMKRKPEQGPDAGGPGGGPSQSRAVPGGRGGARSSPVVARKKAKTNATSN